MNPNEYAELLDRASRLEPAVRMRFLDDLTSLVYQRRTQFHGERGIMELEGLGGEILQGLDAQKYVSQERDSWNG